MQEIIPALEKSWSLGAKELGYEVLTLVADEKKIPSSVHQQLLHVDAIFITAFNVSIAQKLVLLRKRIFIDAPWIFQLHNQATIGLWPVFHWGMGELLTTKDVFISTSSRDAHCFQALFENAKAEIIPFPALHQPNTKRENKRRFCYVGRVSEQKNLHTLLWAYHLYRQKGGEASLDIMGGEDGLGSPNMGMKGEGYLSFLKKTCQGLGLENDVHFLGLQKREQLHEYWVNQDCVMVTPSLHSDENFGMALMQALCYGHCAVATDWGGHTDFAKYFSQQVILLKVYESSTGPYLDVEEFSEALLMAEKLGPKNANIPENYRLESVVDQAKNLLLKTVEKKDCVQAKLRATELLHKVLERVETYQSHKNGQIFESYHDSLAHVFFKLYGMENKRGVTQKVGHAPWCQKKGEKVIVQNPHRGERVQSKEQGQETGDIQ